MGIDAIQQKAKRAFEKANPSIWGKIQGNPELAEKLHSLKDRTSVLRDKMHQHIQKHRQLWIAQETVKVFEEREVSNLSHPSPGWVGQPLNPPYLEEARKRVQHRIAQRFRNITIRSERMQARLLEAPQNQAPSLIPVP